MSGVAPLWVNMDGVMACEIHRDDDPTWIPESPEIHADFVAEFGDVYGPYLCEICSMLATEEEAQK